MQAAAPAGRKLSAAATRKAELLARALRAKATPAAREAAAKKKAPVGAREKAAAVKGEVLSAPVAKKKAAAAVAAKKAPSPSSSTEGDAVKLLCNNCFAGQSKYCSFFLRGGHKCICNPNNSNCCSQSTGYIDSPSSSSLMAQSSYSISSLPSTEVQCSLQIRVYFIMALVFYLTYIMSLSPSICIELCLIV